MSDDRGWGSPSTHNVPDWTAQAPQTNPVYLSPDGRWIWNWHTGQWEPTTPPNLNNGDFAPPARRPTARRRRKPILIAGGVALVVAAGVLTTVLVTRDSSPPARYFDGRGQIIVSSGNWNPFVDGECVADFGYASDDIRSTGPITVNVLGGSPQDQAEDTGQIGVGRISGTNCVFRFEVDGILDLPDDGTVYNVHLPGYPAVGVSKSDLKTGKVKLHFH